MCDDDIYHPEFAQTLVDYLDDNPNVGMAYCDYHLITPDGEAIVRKAKRRYKSDDPPIFNFMKYQFFRMPVPMIFGIFRRDKASEVFAPIVELKDTTFEADNVLVSCLLNNRVQGIACPYMYYRIKDRAYQTPKPLNLIF